MSGKEIIKAIKIKLILNKLSKAKEAAMREILGLPPKQSWTAECTGRIMTCVQDQCLHIFCPCCTYHIDRRQKRLACLSSPTFKEFVGFISGLVMTFLVFSILVFQMDVHPKNACIGCAVGSMLLSLLMAFSLNVRCLVILMLPQFFSGKGRMFLLMYALFLVMNHPVKNAFVNVTVMSQSATCGQELALNETKELIRAATAPLEGMMNNIKQVVKKLVDFSNSLRDTYMALSRTIREIGSTISTAAQWLVNITERCKSTMASPYRQCKEAFHEGIRKCRSKLGILKGACKAGSAFDFLCHVAKVGQAFCFVVDIFKRFIVQPVDSGARKVLKSAKDMFYFNVTIDYNYNYTITQSKSYSQIRTDITNEIKSYTDTYMTVIGYLKNLLLLTLLFVLLKALIYRYRWLTNDRYDNTYITFTVLDLDERRKVKGKAGIIPLTYEEEKKYISDASSTMTRKEMMKLATGLVLFIFSVFNAGFYLFCDYGLYSVLFLIKKHFGKATKAPVPPHTKLHVVGTGPMADMYKSMVTMVEPIAMSHVKIDVTPCVPNPSEPDWNVYRTIGIIYLVCLIMTIGEAYALRLRHMIMGCYFPRRERKRAIWLYNHIMKTRGGLMASARNSIKDRHQGSAITEHISLKGRLAAMFPILEKIFKFLGWEVKSCLYCGREGKPDDYVRFIHCNYFDCDAIYCVDCYADLDNICAVCNNAVDIGGSGESEEIDSSISETDRLRAAVQRKMRNEKIAALQAERTTSRVMTRFKSAFGEPSTSKNSVNNSAALNRNPDYTSQSSESDSDGEIPERQGLLRSTKNTNRCNNMRKVPSFPIYDNGRNLIGRIRSRDVLGSNDNDQSASDYVVYTDYESTCSSSCDSDDLDFSYQYEKRCFDPVGIQNGDRRVILQPRARGNFDFVSYDIYTSSDSDKDGESGDENEHMTEPVSLVIGRK